MSPFMDQYGQMHYEGAAKIKVGVFSSDSLWAFFFIHPLSNLPPVSFSYFIISVSVFKGGAFCRLIRQAPHSFIHVSARR